MSKTLIVMLDAGHGYNTPGKRSPDGSLREFQFNAAVAERVADALDGYSNILVEFVYDRTGKNDVELKTRTDKANQLYTKYKDTVKYDVCYISIHANAAGDGAWNNTTGTETFCFAKTGKAFELATQVQNFLIREAKTVNRGVKADNFHVLRETHMPAILIEAEFMTCKESCENLKSDTFRNRITAGIIKGLVATYKIKPKPIKSVSPVGSPQTTKGETIYIVKAAGSFKNRSAAEAILNTLKGHGIDAYIETK